MSSSAISSPNLDEVRSYVARRVAEGFDSEEDILEDTLEQFAEEIGDGQEVAELVSNLTSELMAEHKSEEANWKGQTDCDKLDKAFSELEENGIVARQNFTCCQNCGHAEIWEEIEQFRQEDERLSKDRAIGYVFYHMQDTERVLEDGTLYLAYGATDNEDDSTIRVAQKAVEILRRNGLGVAWSGSLDKRLCLEKFDWRRRRCS